MGLIKTLKEQENRPEFEEVSTITEFISHTIYRRYPDGRIFPVKTWITQKGVVTPVKPKKVAVSLNAKEEEEVLL